MTHKAQPRGLDQLDIVAHQRFTPSPHVKAEAANALNLCQRRTMPFPMNTLRYPVTLRVVNCSTRHPWMYQQPQDCAGHGCAALAVHITAACSCSGQTRESTHKQVYSLSSLPVPYAPSAVCRSLVSSTSQAHSTPASTPRHTGSASRVCLAIPPTDEYYVPPWC